MTFRQPIQLLRIAGIAVCAITACWALSSPPDWMGWDAFQSLAVLTQIPALQVGLGLCAYACFAWAFWVLMTPGEFFVPSNKKFALMGVQTVLALLLNASELRYLVSAELGFLLPNARGLVWVSAQMVADIGMGFVDPEMRSWMYPATVTQWFPQVVSIFALGPLYHFLSFSFGVLGATESRQRRELERMQEALAEGARLAERLAIARELHDSLGHSLTGLIVKLQLAMNTRDDQRQRHVHEAYLLSRALLNNVRSTVTDLREIEGVELRSALAYVAYRVPSPKVSIELQEGLNVEERAISHALFRCAQEFVTNTVRHADAKKVTIRLAGTPTHYELHAQDDGRGTSTVNAGNGLTGIRERIEELGGVIEIATAPGSGFAVLVRVPRLYQETT